MVWQWMRWALSILLQPGGIPGHVAFIMDGNRRFAAEQNIKKIDGHKKGYGKMVDTIHWCLELGVQHITVYAFSIDNFSRSLEEVEQLMQLSEDKFAELMQEDGLAERKGVEIRILGDLSLAPASVQGSAARLMQKTAALPAKQAVLNICFSYTSREELIHSMDVMHGSLHSGLLRKQDLSPQLLHRCMRTQASPPVDLLIRTSGETRLSDFMLWQASHAQLEWVDCMWPSWTFLGFARCIIRWKLHAVEQQHLKACATQEASQLQPSMSANSSGSTHMSHVTQGVFEEIVDATAEVRLQHRSPTCVSQHQTETLQQPDTLAYMWERPRNWAPHRFAPVWHMIGHHLCRLRFHLGGKAATHSISASMTAGCATAAMGMTHMHRAPTDVIIPAFSLPAGPLALPHSSSHPSASSHGRCNEVLAGPTEQTATAPSSEQTDSTTPSTPGSSGMGASLMTSSQTPSSATSPGVSAPGSPVAAASPDAVVQNDNIFTQALIPHQAQPSSFPSQGSSTFSCCTVSAHANSDEGGFMPASSHPEDGDRRLVGCAWSHALSQSCWTATQPTHAQCKDSSSQPSVQGMAFSACQGDWSCPVPNQGEDEPALACHTTLPFGAHLHVAAVKEELGTHARVLSLLRSQQLLHDRWVEAHAKLNHLNR